MPALDAIEIEVRDVRMALSRVLVDVIKLLNSLKEPLVMKVLILGNGTFGTTTLKGVEKSP